MPIIQDYIKGLSECLEELSGQNIEEIADIVIDAWRQGKRIFMMGNGGSATTASHFARDLQIGAAVEGKPHIRMLSLTDNVALITALANDVDYGSIFRGATCRAIGRRRCSHWDKRLRQFSQCPQGYRICSEE